MQPQRFQRHAIYTTCVDVGLSAGVPLQPSRAQGSASDLMEVRRAQMFVDWKGQSASQQQIGDDTDGPNVYLLIVAF